MHRPQDELRDLQEDRYPVRAGSRREGGVSLATTGRGATLGGACAVHIGSSSSNRVVLMALGR